jgi:hypothetical protein
VARFIIALVFFVGVFALYQNCGSGKYNFDGQSTATSTITQSPSTPGTTQRVDLNCADIKTNNLWICAPTLNIGGQIFNLTRVEFIAEILNGQTFFQTQSDCQAGINSAPLLRVLAWYYGDPRFPAPLQTTGTWPTQGIQQSAANCPIETLQGPNTCLPTTNATGPVHWARWPGLPNWTHCSCFYSL